MLDYGAGVSRTMVFANTVEAVEAVAKILGKAGIECFRYHKDSSLEERAKTLVDFREKGGVFVCTDAAARGVDIPDVSHVIQVLLPINYLLLLVSISYIFILIKFIILFKTRRIE